MAFSSFFFFLVRKVYSKLIHLLTPVLPPSSSTFWYTRWKENFPLCSHLPFQKLMRAPPDWKVLVFALFKWVQYTTPFVRTTKQRKIYLLYYLKGKWCIGLPNTLGGCLLSSDRIQKILNTNPQVFSAQTIDSCMQNSFVNLHASWAGSTVDTSITEELFSNRQFPL